MCWRIGAAVMEQWANPAAHQLGRRCSGLHTIIALLMLARLLETCQQLLLGKAPAHLQALAQDPCTMRSQP